MVFGKHFYKYYFRYLHTFILGALALVLVDLFQLEIPEIVGQIIDAIKEQTLSKELLLGFTERLLIVAAIVFVGRFLWRICIFGNGCKIEADIRNKMFRHMEKMSQTYFSNNKTGALMALYTNDLQTIRQSFGSGTLMFVDALALGILASIKMIKLNPMLTLFCVIPLVIVGAFAMLMRRRISRKVRRNLEAFSSLSDYVQESYSGISVIKAYVKEKRKELLFDGYNKENKDTCIDFVKDHAFVQVTIGAILSVIMVTIIFVGGVLIYQAQTGNIVTNFTPGNLVTFNAYFGSLIWPVMAVGDLINLRGQSKASEKRISELLDEKVEINDLLVEYHDIDPSTIKGEIEYRNLSFNYPDSTVKVLENVNFHINPGEIVGIMGGTGSGKSTIVELLLRLYNIDDDKIFIDGYDIMNMPLKLVRDIIAYVPQETFLFKQTIDENIAFSDSTLSSELIINAATYSGVAKDISEFKDGYNTVLGERGVTVSGGQKQRIAIARALIKNAPILIMDDSLSAVDTITESYILNSLRTIRKDKTTIIIAHRITTLETLDKIIVVEDGTVTNIGTHQELLVKSEAYKKEVALQELEKEVEGDLNER
jgi:ATP-binding cassette subfamily B protein